MREVIFRHTKKLAIAIAGTIVVLLGIVMIPYPGPGWLVVFAGLAILATEFAAAQKILDKVRGKYDEWQLWLGRQNLFIRIIVLSFTGLVILITAWLLNSFGVVNRVFNLDLNWLVSPFFS
ncbi:MAG: TIGR02611 family protein [Candidatus Saccharibacteria bacterium]